MAQMIPLEDYVARVLEAIAPLTSTRVALGEAHGRILAEDVERQGDAEHAVSLIVEDFGVETQPVVSSSCQACDSAEAMIEVRVSVRVPLPFLPAWLGPVGMDVSSSANAPLRAVVAGG